MSFGSLELGDAVCMHQILKSIQRQVACMDGRSFGHLLTMSAFYLLTYLLCYGCKIALVRREPRFSWLKKMQFRLIFARTDLTLASTIDAILSIQPINKLHLAPQDMFTMKCWASMGMKLEELLGLAEQPRADDYITLLEPVLLSFQAPLQALS